MNRHTGRFEWNAGLDENEVFVETAKKIQRILSGTKFGGVTVKECAAKLSETLEAQDKTFALMIINDIARREIHGTIGQPEDNYDRFALAVHSSALAVGVVIEMLEKIKSELETAEKIIKIL